MMFYKDVVYVPFKHLHVIGLQVFVHKKNLLI